ncbi:leucine-rich PPR motif-containing protein, mitochondrial [Hoplias malabaricus]|uniref:leucine-rich PPR motif-containing protein, mitochondrial n=1 Tax=Hoplias malabaricus TaxID=27720 RepID=UPI003461A823
MAALLRSARFLSLSACPLLRASSHTHAAAGRLSYSGAVWRRAAGIGGAGDSLSSYSSALACSTWRCYGTAQEQKGVVKDEPSLGVRTKQAQQFDWALAKLDSSVRRTGRVTKTLLQRIFHDICRTGYPSGNQALLLLRSCGSLLPELLFAERTELAHHIWEKLQELGATYDVSHYNALLKVYLQNEFKFSPTDFLAKMEVANVQPNRVTYQRLIAAYCQDGDIEGASKILAFMKSKDLPITEAVFNSLVTGHSRAGDMESAANILSVMSGAGIVPGPDTYLALLCAYAEKGDIAKIKETLDNVENTDTSLMDRDLMQIIFSLAKAGHQQHVPQIVERMRHERGYVPDAMNLCLSLITQGFEDTAFDVLKTFPSLQAESENGDSPDLGNFFLRHCVNMDKSPEKLVAFCKDLKDSKLHSAPLQFTLYCALDSKKTALAVELMKTMKEEGLPLRAHYFWPLLTQHQKDKNTQGTLEVLKAMQELDVLPDVDTYSGYVLPTFPSVESARAALKDAGCAVDANGFISAEVRNEAASGNLSALFSLMSSPSFPVIDLGAFRGSLIAGFKGSNDVESMAKITELLFKDSRFTQTSSDSAENVAYFLYNLFDGMTETEVQAKEENLREYLNQLKDKKVTIPVNIYRGIRNILDSYHMPELIKDVLILVDKKENLRASDTPTPKGLEWRVEILEKKLEELKSQGKPPGAVFKQLINALCAEENLTRALELKTQYEEEMTPSCYALLINLCCRHDNAEEALNIKRELARKDSEVALDASKYMSLVRVLSKHGKLEEAVDILKEMKEKDVPVKDTTITLLFHTLNSAAFKGDSTTIRRLQDTIFTLGLVNPSGNLCSPLVTVYLENGDLAGALEAAMECHKLYNQLPRIHDIICGLVEKGDTELLQKAMDFVSQERGEMTMLYDLFFAFMQTGRYREARKIIETPGLRARPGRLHWYAEKCIAGQQMEALENMVDMTGKLFECDRDEMYHYMLRLCKETNDWHKAEAVWTKMQEENVIPRERTLRLLADILKSNNQEVPFEVPEVWYEQPETNDYSDEVSGEGLKVEPQPPPRASLLKEASVADYQLKVIALTKKGKAQEALNILMETDRKGMALGPACYDTLIKALLASSNLEDAMAVKDTAAKHISGFKLSDLANNLHIITLVKRGNLKGAMDGLKGMLQADQVPTQLAITRLVQGLGNLGDVQSIQEVENMVKTLGPSINLSSMLFANNVALAHIKNGDIDNAVEGLESVCTGSSDTSHKNISYVFRKVLETNNEDALDKLSAMAERLCNHFASYRAATDLFLQYLDTGRTEEAKFLLQRCAAVAEQKDAMMSYMTKISQKPGQAAKVKTLLEFIPDFAEKETFCGYLMKCYAMDKDLPSAKALYQQMLADGIQVDELSLKRLASLYREVGENVPFEEPPETFRFYAQKLKASKTHNSEDN